jgi:hypothetical protein
VADEKRTTAATPQIQSLNPLVSLTALPTLSPFVRDPKNGENGAKVDQGKEIEEFLKREKVDVVVGCDLARADIVRLSFLSLLPTYTAPLSDLHTSSKLDIDFPDFSSAMPCVA